MEGEESMRIERLEVFQVKLPFKEPFRTSFGDTLEQLSIVVKMESDGAVGWGEADPLFAPIYSSEMSSTAFLVLQEVLVPAVIGRDFASAAELNGAMAFVRGNQFAKSAIETAFWCMLAHAQGKPLHQLLGGTRQTVVAGVSIGLQESPERLAAEAQRFLSHGYQRVKIKVKPGKDIAYARAVRQAFPAIPLMVDANSAYTLDDAAHLRQLDEFGLIMIEQPLAYDDIVDHARLQAQIETPICLDESIHTPADARKSVELRSGKIINIKIGRVGGFANAIAVHDICQDAGWPVWVGGMMDMGLGQALKVEFASLPNVTLANDIAPSNRFYAEDIVDPAVTLNPDGTFDVASGPGIGRQVKEPFIRAHSVQRFEI
jgi:o-succinylbenzoate synthase